MQHFREYIISKRFKKDVLLKSYIEITEKIDGSAFQVYNNQDNIIFGKRGENPYKPVKNIITDFDLLMNPIYEKVYKYLNKYLNIFKNYTILNYEIFDTKYDNHIIKYNGQYKNDIVLLSGLSLTGDVLTNDELKHIADEMNISYNKILWQGYLTDKIISTLLKYKYNDVFIWNYITKELNIDGSKYEGIVINIKTVNDKSETVVKNYKIQNPEFASKLMEHLSNEQEIRDVNLEKIYDLIINTQITYDKTYSHLKNLLVLYMSFEYANKDFTEVENFLKNIEILRNTKINMLLANEIYNLFPANEEYIKYPALLNFILYGFRSKRKRFPLWCSKEYQLTKLNPYLEKHFNL